MASTGKCPFCGATVQSNERTCPQCGAANDQYVAETQRTVFLPKTIDELKEYCAQRGMPLLRMRFFVGEDFREPKAFGIYKDGDRYVVYKNKANGERAIRYQGPDEAYAVNELFQKLLEECHNRGIYPDGKPEGTSGSRSVSQRKSRNRISPLYIVIVCLCALGFILFASGSHKNDGYYKSGSRVVYRYGNDWYYYSDYSHDWYEGADLHYTTEDDAYLGTDYNSDWGTSNFKTSSTWESIRESHSSSSSDYDSWDSSDTDWDSDW